ncbi:hypothetical protein AA106_09910 [Photorhabdus laumondii subsp. laumondii]|nr:hypothetical protein AA106_09910 [Photorhabdus laumondii subsp. laumondii]
MEILLERAWAAGAKLNDPLFAHRRIYGAVATMFAANLPVDVLTLSERLEQKEQLKQVGGFAYLAELGKNTPSAANIVAYAEIGNAGKRDECSGWSSLC